MSRRDWRPSESAGNYADRRPYVNYTPANHEHSNTTKLLETARSQTMRSIKIKRLDNIWLNFLYACKQHMDFNSPPKFPITFPFFFLQKRNLS